MQRTALASTLRHIGEGVFRPQVGTYTFVYFVICVRAIQPFALNRVLIGNYGYIDYNYSVYNGLTGLEHGKS